MKIPLTASRLINFTLLLAVLIVFGLKMQKSGRDQATELLPPSKGAAPGMRPVSGRSPASTRMGRFAEDLPLRPSDRRLASKLARDRELFLALVSPRYEEGFPGSSAMADAFFEDLKMRPGESLDRIRAALKEISPAIEFPLERSTLLLNASALAGSREQVRALSLSELLDVRVPARPQPEAARSDEELNSALSGSQAEFLPIVAHQVFIANAKDAEDALDGTLRGLGVQQDHGVRATLYSQFLERHPEKRQELDAILIQRGLVVPRLVADAESHWEEQPLNQE